MTYCKFCSRIAKETLSPFGIVCLCTNRDCGIVVFKPNENTLFNRVDIDQDWPEIALYLHEASPITRPTPMILGETTATPKGATNPNK